MKKIIKVKKKTDRVVITVLCCFIIFLLILFILLNRTYFNTRNFVIDYLKLEATNYMGSKEDSKVINRKDEKCHIILSSKVTTTNDLLSLGNFEKINNHDWVKQEFENGITWMSYYKNSFYIVQMYGDNKYLYNNSCKKDFEKIKNTFSFMNSE